MFSAFNQYQCTLDKSTAWRATLLPNHYHYPKRMSLTKNHPIYIQQSGTKKMSTTRNTSYQLFCQCWDSCWTQQGETENTTNTKITCWGDTGLICWFSDFTPGCLLGHFMLLSQTIVWQTPQYPLLDVHRFARLPEIQSDNRYIS